MLITPHLVGYWPFEGNANDASGNGNNGTVYGASLTKGKFGQCYSFDGMDDYIDCGNNENLSSVDKITISTWVKTNSISSYQGIVAKMPYQGGEGWNLTIAAGGKIKFMAGDGSDNQNIYSDNAITANTWYHLVILKKDVTRYLYVNGVQQQQTVNRVIASTTEPLVIGRYYSPGVDHIFNGLINQVQIYNKALSQSDVRRIMLGMHPLNG